MSFKSRVNILSVLILLGLIASSCNSTRHLKEGEYLLDDNVIEFDSKKYLNNKSIVTDRLEETAVQQPNSSFVFDWFRPKLFFYNLRYDKYQKDSTNYQLKSNSVEPPVLYDSSTLTQSKTYMKSYLFNQGYFYAEVTDTTEFNTKRKKADVIYKVNTGTNYLINRVYFEDIENELIKEHVREAFDETFLRAGKPYTATLMDEERTRITNYLKDRGYYYFSKGNISFVLDTTKKEQKKLDENLLQDAAELFAQKENTRPTLDIYINVDDNEDSTAFKRYGINKIYVFPDFVDRSDATDSTLITHKIDSTTFKYHRYYIRRKVIHNHIFVTSNTYFSQSDYDKTLNELNGLGVFSSVRMVFFDDTSRKDGTNWLNCAILMTPSEKYDFNINWESSTGTTYDLGSGVNLSLVNKNIANGANRLTMSTNAAVETQYSNEEKKLLIFTTTLGANVSLEFPKFLLPISKERYSIRNTPRTEIALGASQLDRTNFFRLINLSSRYTYKWRETKTKSWEVTPFFINDISLPDKHIDSNFKERLKENELLRNIYRETFIEGENITWTYTNAGQAKFYDDYSYVKLGLEEAGALLNGMNTVSGSAITAAFSQYARFDYDLRHFIVQKHATTALRLHGGVGVPYGTSAGGTLPYVKQFFVGGPFSLRGWAIRKLGPGSSYIDTTQNKVIEETTSTLIDRTGDIKIELNTEYRFDMFRLFSGIIQFDGALFADMGNVWLANKSQSAEYINGEFKLSRLYTDIAVDAGVGVRMDIAELFVFRLDMGVPLKVPGNIVNPYYGIKQGWVIKDIDPLYSEWRKRNMIFNIAIGYPF